MFACVRVSLIVCVWTAYFQWCATKKKPFTLTHETAHTQDMEKKQHYNLYECTSVKFASRAIRTLTLTWHTHTVTAICWIIMMHIWFQTYQHKHRHTPAWWHSLILNTNLQTWRHGNLSGCRSFPDSSYSHVMRVSSTTGATATHSHTLTHTHTCIDSVFDHRPPCRRVLLMVM